MSLILGTGQLANSFLAATPTITTVQIPACPDGFQMGSDAGIYADEAPVHEVVISKDIFVGETPVTNGQFDHLVGRLGDNRFVLMAPDPRTGYYHLLGTGNGEDSLKGVSKTNALKLLERELRLDIDGAKKALIMQMGDFRVFEMGRERYGGAFEGVNKPVVGVHHYISTASAELWGLLTGEVGKWRLLTEAEWEYAARGKDGKDCGDDTTEWLNKRTAHYNAGSTLDVRQKRPNSFGLHDMIGNVWEWVSDWYGPYQEDGATDPSGPLTGDSRVLRGGSFNDDPRLLRAAFRFDDDPDYRLNLFGFRLVRLPRAAS